ncbi:hypothetical protein LX36DRAFT_36507 [Colletotrichum falcatum]|nr:hypothetical protein LX36DRAFT_36507 [Colletotrichum falcatum]
MLEGVCMSVRQRWCRRGGGRLILAATCLQTGSHLYARRHQQLLPGPRPYANYLDPCLPDDVLVFPHVDRVQLSPDFGMAQTEGSSPGWDVFAMYAATSDRKSINDIFLTDKITGRLVVVAFSAKFSRVRMSPIVRLLSRSNPLNKFGAVSSKLLISTEFGCRCQARYNRSSTIVRFMAIADFSYEHRACHQYHTTHHLNHRFALPFITV